MKLFRTLFRRRALEAEMAEELALHLEARTRENLAAGMSPEAARYAALRRFGGVEQVKERCRDQQRHPWTERLVVRPWQLLRQGGGSVRRTPLLALTIIGTLGIALAACVLVFAFLNAFLFRPLPLADASRLVVVYEHSIKGGRGSAFTLTYDNLVAIEERANAFSRLGIMRVDSAPLHQGGTAEAAALVRVNADLFPLLGAKAALGTVITPGNVESGGVRAVVLADGLWRRRFAADPAVIGRTVRIGDQPFRVVGVMPADFEMPLGGGALDAWPALLPTDYRPTASTPHRYHVRHLLWAELAPGVSLEVANARLAAVAASLRRETPKENADRDFFAQDLRDNLLGDFGRQLVLLQGAVLLVLVVASFNCVCLLLAQALQRRREFAVRLALGASRGDLFAQLLAESLWLCLPAAALALGLAALALPWGATLLPLHAQPSLGLAGVPVIDGTVMAVVIFAALGIALAFSLVPLVQTRRMNLDRALREGGRSAGARGPRRAARVLAAGQIAVAVALLIAAALLVRSQSSLKQLDRGLPATGLDLFHVGLRGDHYMRDPAARLRFFTHYREALLALPGVEQVGVASFFLGQPPTGYQGFVQEGDGLNSTDTPKRALTCSVLPAIFDAVSLRLIAGRLLQETDGVDRPPVAVVNATLAAKLWPGESPLGKRVRLQSLRAGPYANEWVEIVGVVADVYGSGNQPRVVDTFYLTIAQAQPPGLGMGFYIRHAGPAPGARDYQRILAQVDPTLQIFAHSTPAEFQARSAWQSRFVTQLIGAFAALAVGLALAGVYAVNAFFVTGRTAEFGLRAALGASRQHLLVLVLGDSARIAWVGLAAGMVLAWGAARSLSGLLFGVAPLDLPLYAGAALVMAAACAVATLLPARRAARVDPLTALRAS
jgi:predicted permease